MLKPVAVSLLAAFAAVSPQTTSAAPITVPPGLNPGDQYRLVFVTSTARDATSTNIADYNAFVSTTANSVAELFALATDWTSIASTATVDARDNTSTNPALDAGMPIYRLDGVRLATSNSDLWDDVLEASLSVNEHGATIPQTFVWTGTLPDGTGHDQYHLGSPSGFVLTGQSSDPFAPWIAASGDSAIGSLPVYAISGVLTVVPEPGTMVLASLAAVVVSLMWLGRGWKRRVEIQLITIPCNQMPAISATPAARRSSFRSTFRRARASSTSKTARSVAGRT
jgi:hypothetical protein